jgi:hypothetical protein
MNFRKKLIFYGEELLAPRPAPKLEDHPLVCFPQQLIQYIRSYPPYLEAVSSICNLRTCHAMVTRDPPTWSLTLREEHRLRVFENRVLRRIFGPKRDEVMGVWRKVHNEELHNLYFLPNITRTIKSRRMRWAGHIAQMGRIEMHVGYWWGSQKERDH